MATKNGRRRLETLATLLTLGVVALGGFAGCAAGHEPNAILSIGSRNLRCPRSDLETALHRESSQTAEYYVGCDFMYTRVLCDKQAATCHPKKPQPPCFGGGCFRENPLTFEWELDETLASNVPASDGRELFSEP
ncbi:MAG TPA: hypothetical protein VNG33_22305 [Polyangiaceae bacterium]|nr:hypothetical protein [Polyangiaceae bacterium]